jgi:DNA-binding CsgD family transcriptional regulator
MPSRLNRREELHGNLAEVARGVLDGLTAKEIGNALGVCERTVKSYLASLYLRFDIDSCDKLRTPRILLALAIHAACPNLCRTCCRDAAGAAAVRERSTAEYRGDVPGDAGVPAALLNGRQRARS